MARHTLHRAYHRLRRLLSPPIIVTDEYVEWLCYANAGMLDRGNLHLFDYALAHLPSAAPMVEIGSFCGLSTNVLAYYRGRHGIANAFFACDPWTFENSSTGPLGGNQAVTHEQYREFVKQSFLKNVGLFSRDALPFAIEMGSDDFFKAWGTAAVVVDVFGRTVRLGGPISFCYIDGAHAYEAVKRDFANSDALLEIGGFLLFDDSVDGSDWEVCRVVDEVKATGRYETVLRNPNYLLRKLTSPLEA